MKDYPDRAVDLMLDSGAFSAWSHGREIDLQSYIKYVKRNLKHLFTYVTLDVLPFGAEAQRSAASIEKCAEMSDRNHQVMKDAGLAPMPVYHQGEGWKWLERMVKNKEPLIGISSRKDLWPEEQSRWLDEVFSVLCDDKGRPLVRTHGFGITNPAMLRRYPFWSVDSTTWSLTPAYGLIIVPKVDAKGEFDYSLPPSRVVTSGVQHKIGSNQRMQFEGMIREERTALTDVVERYLKEVGVTLSEVRYMPDARRRVVLYYYLQLGEHLRDIRYVARTPDFFREVAFTMKGKPVPIDHLHIQFATQLNQQWSALLNSVQARSRLLSYFELQTESDEVLVEYVTTGINGDYQPRVPPKANWGSEHVSFTRMKRLERLQELLGRGAVDVEDETSAEA